MPKQKKEKIFITTYQKIKEAIDYILNQRHRQALKLLREVLFLQPQHANSLFLMSICLDREKFVKEAKIHSQKAYQLNQSFYRGNSLSVNDFLQKLSKLYNQNASLLKKVNNLSYQQWLQTIQPYLQAGDYNSCQFILNYFQVLIKKEQIFNDQTISHFGIKYYEIGKYEESIKKYEQAIKLSPNDPMYYHNVALLNYALGNYIISEQYILKSLQIDPNRPKSFYLQSFIYSKTGRISQALQKIRESLRQSEQQILYKIKMITTLLLHYPQKLSQVKKHIKQGTIIAQRNRYTGVYFKGRQAFPEILNFLNEDIQNKLKNKNWIEYINLLDDFLIKGLSDKSKIKYRMKLLSEIMLKQIKFQQQSKKSSALKNNN